MASIDEIRALANDDLHAESKTESLLMPLRVIALRPPWWNTVTIREAAEWLVPANSKVFAEGSMTPEHRFST